MSSSKIQKVVGAVDASSFVKRGTPGRKMLDSALYDFTKWMIQRCPYEVEPKTEDFEAFLSVCFAAWCRAFPNFDVMKETKLEASATRRASFPAHMKRQVRMYLLILKRQENMRKKLYQKKN